MRCTSATRLLQRLAHIRLCTDADERRALGHFVVIGGGFSGVEVAGAIADFIASARRWYRAVRADELRVSLLHDGERLLPELPARLGESAARSLRQRGVDVRAARARERRCRRRRPRRRRAARVAQRRSARSAHAAIRSSTGSDWRRSADASSPPPDGRVPQHPGLWAVGDCAANAQRRRRPDQPGDGAVRRGAGDAVGGQPHRQRPGTPTHAFAYRSAG